MRNETLTPPAGFRAPHELAHVTKDTPVAVALSGGADSVALLHMLCATACPLHALHVHHGIRGEEADRDATFCQALCEEMNVPFTLIHLDVPTLAKEWGEGIETAARRARYEAFATFLRERHISLLATAHHADDQLETMLQHLLRGAGLRGLCGIPACRALGDALVVRPLLHVCKDEILAYCERASLPFVTDSTNEEPCCPRNRLRLEVMPVLRELWPKGADAAARCATSLAEDEALLSQMAADFIQQEGATPSCTALAALPLPIFARVMHALLPMPPEATHVKALYALVQEARPQSALSIPGATVRVVKGSIWVENGKETACTPYDIPLNVGETVFPCGIAILAKGIVPIDDKRVADFPFSARITFRHAATNGTLTLRPRKTGERILAGKNHKLVRKLPCMSRYPSSVRARMPLLCDDDGVLAVPTGPVRDGATSDADTTLLLLFR